MDQEQRNKERKAKTGGPEEQKNAAFSRNRAEGYQQKLFALPYNVVREFDLPFDVEDKWGRCLIVGLDRDKREISPLKAISLGSVHGNQSSQDYRGRADDNPEDEDTCEENAIRNERRLSFFLALEESLIEYSIRSQNGIYVHRVDIKKGRPVTTVAHVSPADIDYRST